MNSHLDEPITPILRDLNSPLPSIPVSALDPDSFNESQLSLNQKTLGEPKLVGKSLFNRFQPEEYKEGELPSMRSDTEVVIGSMLFQKSLLFLTIKSASNLKKMDIVTMSDPFVEVTFKSQIVKTETIANNKNPVFNSTFTFTIEEADFNEMIVFKMFDGNNIVSKTFIGQYQIKLKTLLADKHQNKMIVELDDLTQPKPGERKEKRGTLTFTWLKQTVSQLGEQKQIDEIRAKDKSLQNGVLKAEIHHVEGGFEKKEYYLGIECAEGLHQTTQAKAPKSASNVMSSIFKKPQGNETKPSKPPLQIQSSFSFDIKNLLTTSMTISLIKKDIMLKQDKKLGTFTFNLVQALDLNNTITGLFELKSYKPDPGTKQSEQGNLTTDPPRVFLTLTYIHSLFTEYPRGTLSLRIKAWTMNEAAFAKDFYVNFKTGTGPAKECRSLQTATELQVSSLLETLDVRVLRDVKLKIDPEIGMHQIRVFELFRYQGDIVFQDNFYKFAFKDHKDSQEVQLSIAARFRPSDKTEAQLLEMFPKSQTAGKQKAGGSFKDLEGLFKKSSNVGAKEKTNKTGGVFTPNESDDEEGQVDVDPQFKNLNVVGLPSFTDRPRGVLILKLGRLEIQTSEEKTDQPWLYFIIKNSKMCIRTKTIKQQSYQWSETVGVKTSDIYEQISIKLIDERTGATLAETNLIPKDILQNETSWKFVEINPVLKSPPGTKQPKEMKLGLSAYYRCSKFTAFPRGTLAAQLRQGVELKYNKQAYSPIMEVIVDKQKLKISEHVNSSSATWHRQKDLEFETSTIWDVLEVRFFVSHENGDFVLLGTYQRPLSSIYFDDDNCTDIPINLKSVNEALSGKIIMKYEYRTQQKDKVEFDIQKHPPTNASQNQMIIEKKRGLCYLKLQEVNLQGATRGGTNINNVRFEILYKDLRFLSRTTTNLSITQYNEILEDQFRVMFQDVTQDKYAVGEKEEQIRIKAYNIDFSKKFENGTNQQLLGEATLDPSFFRSQQGTEIIYQVAIKIPSSLFKQKRSQNLDQANEEDKREIDDMLDELVAQNTIYEGDFKKPKLLLTFHAVYIATSFTRNPQGFITLNNLALLNLQNYIPDSDIKDNGIMYLSFKIQDNKNKTLDAKHSYRLESNKQLVNEPLDRQNLALFSQEFDPIDVMKTGKCYLVQDPAVAYWMWSQQIVLYSKSPFDSLEIKLIHEKPIEGNLLKTNKLSLAHISINIADMSYFFDQSTKKEVDMGVLMDFEEDFDYKAPIQRIATSIDRQKTQTKNAMNPKSLLGPSFAKSLILLMDCRFHAEELILKQQTQLMLSNQKLNFHHMLVDFKIKDLEGILRENKANTTIYGFMILETLKTEDPINTYMQTVVNQYRQALKHSVTGLSSKEVSPTSVTSKKFNQQTGFGGKIEEFFIDSEFLLKPVNQISKIFEINAFEIYRIDQLLEAWVPILTKKTMLSLVTQIGKSDQLESFQVLLQNETITQQNTVLGILKRLQRDLKLKELTIYQSLIDFSDDLNTSSTPSAKQESNQITTAYSKEFIDCANLAQLTKDNPSMQNAMSLASVQVHTKVQTSKLIDSPSGVISVVLRKIIHNNPNFTQKAQTNCVKIELKSRISRNMLPFQDTEYPDQFKSHTLDSYSKRTEKNNRNVITINEVAPFFVRHYCDCLVLSISGVTDNSPMFKTKVELNNLTLNDDKLVLQVLGTTPMKSRGPPLYYIFEIELLFQVKLQSSEKKPQVESAYAMYKLLKNNNNLNSAEEQIISMMLQRSEMGKRLTPARVKLRKAKFLLRKMVKTSYQSLDMNSQACFRVHPAKFFFNMNEDLRQKDYYIQQDRMKQVSAELGQGKSQSSNLQEIQRYKNIALQGNQTVESNNILILEFRNGINLMSSLKPGEQLRYKKLLLIVIQDDQTILKLQYDKNQLLSETLLKDTKIIVKNAKSSSILTFRLMVEEESQTLKSAQQDKQTQIAQAVVKVNSLEMKTWQSVERVLGLAHYQVNVKYTLLYSEFSKNPHKVINLTFHRLLKINQQDFAPIILSKKEEADDVRKYRFIVKEEEIMQKNTDKSSPNKPSLTNKFGSMLLAKTSTYQEQQLDEQGGDSQAISKSGQPKFKLLIEYENCLEYKGDVSDHTVIDINQYGKCCKYDLQKIQINNTKYDNQIVFKLCVDPSGGLARNKSLIPIAQAKFNIAEVQTLANYQLNFYVPVKSVDEMDLQMLWSKTTYDLEGLYILASIKITDRTFGELNIAVNSFQSVPKSLELRELQWRVLTRPYKTSTNRAGKLQEEKEAGKSSRIPYDMNESSLKVDRVMNHALFLKDIFSDQEAFLRPSTLQLYQDIDVMLIFQLLGYTTHNQMIILGEKQLSMIETIQRQMLRSREVASQQTKTVKQNNLQKQELLQRVDKAVEQDFAGCSSRFQKLFKDTYVKFNQTQEQQQKEMEEKKRERSMMGTMQSERSFLSSRHDLDIPEDFQQIQLTAPPYMQDDLTQIPPPKDLEGQDPPSLVVKVDWSFSYKLKIQHTDNFHEVNEELIQMQRVKEKKKIRNILKTLDQVKTVPELVNSHLQTLAVVLASESCASINTLEEMKENQVLRNIGKIIECVANLYKEYHHQLPFSAILSIMKCITYLKISAECSPIYLKKFEIAIRDSLLVDAMMELFEDTSADQSKLFTVEFFTFISNLIADFNQFYFDHISGSRLDPLLKFFQTGKRDKDYQMLDGYVQFLNAVGQCLFNFKPDQPQLDENKSEEENARQHEMKVELVRSDMIKISQSINAQMVKIVEGVQFSKNAYEKLTKTLTEAALQFIHVAVFKADLIKNDIQRVQSLSNDEVSNEDQFLFPDILMNIFKILIDGIISMLALDFIQELKKRLIYEISLVKSLDIKETLLLLFDNGVLLGLLKALTQHFYTISQLPEGHKREQGFRFFEKTKLILEFFYTDVTLNAFAEAEDNRKTIRAIVTDKLVEDQDFVLFLHRVVKIDAEMESEIEGETKKERIARTIQEKYGTMVQINKFSMSRIEWLEDLQRKDDS